MTPEQYKLASKLMQKLGELDAAGREAFLERFGPSLDQEVMREVKDLLRFLSPERTQIAAQRLLSNRQLPQHPRFVLGQCLGSGAFGEVYEAVDQQRQMPIAIKILRQTDPDRLRRFRHEFRTLSGVSHPNLVKLYQLFYEGQWFFTMELVRGVDFLSHVRKGGCTVEAGPLCAALLQLAEGIEALHQRDLLHRDIKPGNVLVTPEGRVVLLDFGLVKELVDQTTQQTIAGTPDYMAPEQFAQAPITPAADWYAYGVMIYQALSGQAPFRGTLPEIASLKAQEKAELPEECQKKAPSALVDLCHRLLDIAPARRPGPREIFTVLAEFTTEQTGHPVEKRRSPAQSIVGRERQLGRLHESLQRVRDGLMVVATISGSSGMGKTALAQTFCRQVRESEPGAVILSGACYENELVPFKALDGLMEGLNACLRTLPAAVCQTLLPYDFHCLTKLFPALSFHVPIPAGLRQTEILESQEVRKRAFTALMDLLQRLAERHTVVLFLDDLQWGDLDSAGFFRQLFRTSNPPRLLFLGAYRAEDAESSFLRSYREDLAGAECDVLHEEIEVGELTEEETFQLAGRLQQKEGDGHFHRVFEDCGGCPFLVEQFARHAGQGLSLKDLLDMRLRALGVECKHLLEIIAIAGQPIPERLLRSSSGLSQAETHQRLSSLLEDRLIRIQESAEQRMVDIYHARIRETVVSAMDRVRKQTLHLHLAVCCSVLPDNDPAFLSLHFLLAGDRDRFTEQAVLAAERALTALAFSRAAGLYRQLIEHGHPGTDGLYRWRARLAQALVNADRVVEGAESYALCAEEAPAAEVVEMSRLAAQNYLRAGHLREGLHFLRSLARLLGMKLPEQPWRIWVELAILRAYVAVRGYGFRENTAVSPSAITRLEVYWTLAGGYMVGMLAATLWNAKHLVLALSSGDPHHLSLALAFEAAFSSFRGEPGYQKGQHLLLTASELAVRHGDSHALGIVAMVEAIAALVTGRWKVSIEQAERAEKILLEQCKGVAWELATVRVFRLGAMNWRGDWRDMALRYEHWRKDAEERGDRYASTQLVLSTFSACQALSEDRPEQAERSLREALARWERMDFDVPAFWGHYGILQTMLYRGASEEAWKMLHGVWPQMWRALHSNISCQMIVVAALHVRGSCALGKAATEDNRSYRTEMIAIAAAASAKIRAMKTTWAEGMASICEAGVLLQSGDSDGCIRRLLDAETQFGFANMKMYAAASRYRRGTLLGGDEGQKLVAESEEYMKQQGILRPAFMARMLAPGLDILRDDR